MMSLPTAAVSEALGMGMIFERLQPAKRIEKAYDDVYLKREYYDIGNFSYEVMIIAEPTSFINVTNRYRYKQEDINQPKETPSNQKINNTIKEKNLKPIANHKE